MQWKQLRVLPWTTKRLLPGVYVSRKDSTGHDVVTTFDIRMTRPNF